MKAVPSNRGDAGFTLVELLIVVALLGLVMTALSAAALVLIRVAQENEVDIDETRAERSLDTWLAEDTASTPRASPPSAQGGFDLDPLADPCSAGAGDGLAALAWVDGLTAEEWIVNYRLEPRGDEYEMVRYTCGAFSGARTVVVHGIEASAACEAPEPMASLDSDFRLTLQFCLTEDDPPTVVTVGSRNPVVTT